MPPSAACMYCSHPQESGRGFWEAWHLLFLANTLHMQIKKSEFSTFTSKHSLWLHLTIPLEAHRI